MEDKFLHDKLVSSRHQNIYKLHFHCSYFQIVTTLSSVKNTIRGFGCTLFRISFGMFIPYSFVRKYVIDVCI
jgi:hypothetical protein